MQLRRTTPKGRPCELDRIIHNAYTIDIRSSDPHKDISMREIYGLDKKLSR